MGKPRKMITAQKAAMTLKRVRMASGFSGGGRRGVGVVVVIVWSETVWGDVWGSFLAVMATCLRGSGGWRVGDGLEMELRCGSQGGVAPPVGRSS